MQTKQAVFALVAVVMASLLLRSAQAQLPGAPCLTASDTSAQVLNIVKDIVTSTDSADSVLRDSLGIQGIAASDVVLITDGAKCQQAVDSLNAHAVRHGGAGQLSGLYLVGMGTNRYAAYEVPTAAAPSMFIFFLDAQFQFLKALVIP